MCDNSLPICIQSPWKHKVTLHVLRWFLTLYIRIWHSYPTLWPRKLTRECNYLSQSIGIKHDSITPHQTKVWEVCTRFRSVVPSMQFTLPIKWHVQLLFTNPKLRPSCSQPSIIFIGTKLDILTQHPVPYDALYYAKRVSNKYEPHMDNGFYDTSPIHQLPRRVDPRDMIW